MNRKETSEVMLTLLISSMLAMAFDIQPVEAEIKIWYVDDDGGADFTTIQEAINAADPRDIIYVYNGTYYETLVVTKSLRLVGENRNATIIDGSQAGIVIDITADNTIIESITICNGINGIWVEESVSNVSITRNMIVSNKGFGVLLDDFSHDNVVIGNIVAMNERGITMLTSYNNTLRDNNICDNRFNFQVSGFSLSAYNQDVDGSNTVDGKPIYYLVGQHDQQIPADAGCVVIVNSTEITVRGLNLSRNWEAATFAYSRNCVIEHVNATDNWEGISMYHSNTNTIEGNVLAANYKGVLLMYSANNTISRNIITNNYEGIQCIDSQSTDNKVIGNTVKDNSWGIALCSDDNVIYHNNFVNNTRQVYSFEHVGNTWDNGYPFGGNYWSDYAGNDTYSGLYQNETSYDWIGDAPYVIDENNQDDYPLMKPYAPETEEVRIMYRKLLEKYNALLTDYDKLNSTYCTLSSNYTGLQGDYDALNSSYNDLNATYNELKSDQEATLKKLNNARDLMYGFMATAIAFIVTTVYFAIGRPKIEPRKKPPFSS